MLTLDLKINSVLTQPYNAIGICDFEGPTKMFSNPIPNILPNMDFTHFRHQDGFLNTKLRGAIHLINFTS